MTDHTKLDELLKLSAAIMDAEGMDQIAATLTRSAAPLVDAANAAIGVVARREGVLRVFQGPTPTAGNAAISLVDLAEHSPLTDAVRRGEPVVIESAEQFLSIYPRIARRTAPGDVSAMVTYPVQLDDVVLGACFFRFADGVECTLERFEVMDRMPPLLARAVARIQDRDDLVAYARRLEQSNRDLDNFAAVVAHDLSAPVRRIGSYLQLLEREVGSMNDKGRRYAATIHEQVNHLDALLRDTLAYAQVVAPVDTRQVTPLRPIVDDVLGALRPEFAAADAVATVSDLPSLDIEVTLVAQVFENLFENALKYRDVARPPRIEVAAEPVPPSAADHRRWWKVTVSDNGIGIDPDRYGEVFAMFARLEVSKDRPGTGVGLAFVKRVVERHGGEVGIAPGIDGGTTFWFTLPGRAEPDVL